MASDWDDILRKIDRWDIVTDEQQRLIMSEGDPERLRQVQEELRLLEPYRQEYVREVFFDPTSPHYHQVRKRSYLS